MRLYHVNDFGYVEARVIIAELHFKRRGPLDDRAVAHAFGAELLHDVLKVELLKVLAVEELGELEVEGEGRLEEEG
jgi:hypothetical protein